MTDSIPKIYQNFLDNLPKKPSPHKFTPPKEYENIPVLHVSVNDKDADLPLLISCENGQKAIIPTSKNAMKKIAHDYFKIFNKKGNNFVESKHQDGEIYQITIPGLKNPEILRKYIVFKESLISDNNLDERFCDELLPEKTFVKLLIQNLTNDNCMEFYCISKFWQDDTCSQLIKLYVTENFDVELLSKCVYEYDFVDFSDKTNQYFQNEFSNFGCKSNLYM